MIANDPFRTLGIPDEIELNLIVIMQRKVKLRLRPVEMGESVRLGKGSNLSQYIVMYGHIKRSKVNSKIQKSTNIL